MKVQKQLLSGLRLRLLSMQSTKKSYIKLAQGTLFGVQEVLPNGKPIFAYRGIPYAEPPLGKLRFQLPIPLRKFDENVLDCSIERDVCAQTDMITNEFVGSENCLFLNVYSPEEKSNQNTNKLPVMLYLHGGGFTSGSGASDLYSPEYLVQENVIVVTCNYRIGPFGFLYFPKFGIYGNAGLYDQLLVMKWINENIKEFNGDPGNVTLFGESAGGACAHIHFISPVSRKYFHKVICQSGTITMDWVMQVDPLDKTKKLASLLGCKSDKDQDIHNCLQTAATKDIVSKTKGALSADELYRGLPFPFKPVLEKRNKEAIFQRYPNEKFTQMDDFDIPIIIGYNSHEALITAPLVYKKIHEFSQDFKKFVPMSLNVSVGSWSSQDVAKEIKKFYFGETVLDIGSILQLIDIMSDIHFVNGLRSSLSLLKIFQKKSPIYFYRFSYDGELNLFKQTLQLKVKGACHADELFYLFNAKLFGVELDENSDAARMRKNMCQLWTNFAKYGNPTPDFDTSLSFKWTPTNQDINDENVDCLELNDDIKMIQNPDNERYVFWKNVYKTWNESFLRPKL